MDRLRKGRRPFRAAVTRTCGEIDVELAKAAPDIVSLQLKMDHLDDMHRELKYHDEKVADQILDDNCTEEEQDAEFAACEEYTMKWRTARAKGTEAIIRQRPVSPTGSETSYQSASGDSKRRNFKLPKIELKKFGGELSEWLGWWAQFSKIDEDESLHASDKFQYLIGSMQSGSKAEDLVKAYPQSEIKYPKAVAALKQRFGNEGLLKEMYIREMLKLVVNNAKSKEKVSLGKMFIQLESHLRSLESLGVEPQQMGDFLYPMVESSLPEETLIAWQRSSDFGKDKPTEDPTRNKLDYLLAFLRQEVRNEEQRAIVRSGFDNSANKKESRTKCKKELFSEDVPTVAGLHIGQSSKCVFCEKSNHASQDCYKAQAMTWDEKKKIISEKNGCFCCLKPGHRANKCKTRVHLKCTGCSKNHHYLMCPDNPRNIKERENIVFPQPVETAGVHTNCDQTKLAFLKTLLVRINNVRTVRVLVDEGSQKSYVRADVAAESKCVATGTTYERNSLFGGLVTDIEKRTNYIVPLSSLDGKVHQEFELLDKKQIAGGIPKIPWGPWSSELRKRKICLSDTIGATDGDEIDVLIGVDQIKRFVTGRRINLKGELLAVETIFGWTLMGTIPGCQESIAMTVTSLMVTEATPAQLWELEVLGINDPAEHKSKMEKEAEVKEHFLQTVARNADGRYCVRLPWVGGVQEIPNNKGVAEKRLQATTQKLKKDGKFREYDDIFRGWEKEEFIECFDPNEVDSCHYLPHRPVYKPTSLTTPIRPVFDASCKVGRNPSLNDCLEKGPNYIELIPAVILRFREGKIGVLADIRKAFPMVEVAEADRDYLRFLWWQDDTCTKLKEFRHRRVVFGVTCSPFLLGAVIEHHLKNVRDEDKLFARKLLNSFYVDNCVTSVESIQEYEELKANATRIMALAKMELRQWEFGPVEVSGAGCDRSIQCRLDNGRNKIPIGTSLTPATITNVLGMEWDKQTDSLSCVVYTEMPDQWTRRTLLSMIQKIYDPMGFLSPAMILPKLILQETWDSKLKWDEELSDETKLRFKEWMKNIHYLGQIRIPRNIAGGNGSRRSWQLHVFSDASKKAYAAIVYLRVQHNDHVTVQLLQSKARVAPLKKVSIPRLELLGCSIAARLNDAVKKAFDLNTPTIYWTDSTTALAWIKRNNKWGTFVGNRVKEICNLSTPQEWRHVPGLLNPADLPSRGCTPEELKKSKWWEGPRWLKLSPEEWPNAEIEEDEEAICAELKKEPKTTAVNLVKVTSDPWYAAKFSSFVSSTRVMAWMLRFIAKARKQKSEDGELTTDEVQGAEIRIWSLVQQEVFSSNKDLIRGIRVDIGEDGLYRAKTKLLHRQDSEEFRLPIVLPPDHPMVERLIREEHLNNCHAGVQFLMSKLREKYWILKSRKAIKKIAQSCQRCRRFKAKAPVLPPAALPENRVKDCRVFEVTGIDLAGPLYVKDHAKFWIALFTCAVYRAVHLELVSSLNTDSFLLALYRFISRRGRPSIIYSDNGTNFVGASNLFDKMDWKQIEKETRIRRIQWNFNPPSAPWWGGWWERLIQTMKDLLRKMLGHKKLSYIQLETALCEVEAVINARPLTCVTEDPDDLIPLTPAAFMQDLCESHFPEVETLDAVGFRKKYRYLAQLKEELRQRFRSEYLGLLIQKYKTGEVRELQVGEVVLIECDNRKRLDWPMARIMELMPGKDGKSRVARVKTAVGELVRPLQRLIPLEVSSVEASLPISKEVQSRAKTIRDLNREKKNDPEIVTRLGRKVNKPVRLGFE